MFIPYMWLEKTLGKNEHPFHEPFTKMMKEGIIQYGHIDGSAIHFAFTNHISFGFKHSAGGGSLSFFGYQQPNRVPNYSKDDSTGEWLIKVDPRLIYYLDMFDPNYIVGAD